MASSTLTRHGRDLQRYNSNGGRLVVGCIPYRFTVDKEHSLQVLVVIAQNGHSFIFPKGGWEKDESMEQAAQRETFEEAGVQGNLEEILGSWRYKSKTRDSIYEGYFFPMKVTKEFEQWPEKKEGRQRKWVSVNEAKEGCPHGWMKDALEKLVERLSISILL